MEQTHLSGQEGAELMRETEKIQFGFFPEGVVRCHTMIQPREKQQIIDHCCYTTDVLTALNIQDDDHVNLPYHQSCLQSI